MVCFPYSLTNKKREKLLWFAFRILLAIQPFLPHIINILASRHTPNLFTGSKLFLLN